MTLIVCGLNKYFRLTCDYMLVGVMLHEKLVKRDKKPVKFTKRDCTTPHTPEDVK